MTPWRTLVGFLFMATLVTAQNARALGDRVVLPGGPGVASGLKAVFVSGDEEYRSEEALPQLARIMSVHHGMQVTVLFSQDEDGTINPDRSDRIPGLDIIPDADLLVLFLRFRQLPDADMKFIVDHVEAGKPLIALRTATHAFAYKGDSTSKYKHWNWNGGAWPGGFGKQVLGETWVAHHGRHGTESTRGVVPVAARRHPMVRGVKDVWGPTDVYAVRDLPLDSTVILEGAILSGMSPDDEAVNDARNMPRMPIAWTRERVIEERDEPQRIFTSTIAAATDFESEDLRRLFVNACLWTTGREDAIPERAVADIVGTYEPTNFGFGAYVKGRHAADYAWPQASAR